jgi:hypothetical protein
MPPDLPFPVVRVLSRYLRQLYQLFVRTKPVLQAPDDDVFFFEEYLPEPGMALNLNIGQYRGIRQVHFYNLNGGVPDKINASFTAKDATADKY